jgi:DNA repair protein RadD
MLIKERWYQSEAEYSILEYFANGNKGNPVIALPTGTGKSIVIGNFLRHIFGYWPNQRVMMLTHVKELISQNAEKLMKIWPNAPLGIYSAGLQSRDMAMPIVFGGIQSVAKVIKRSVKAKDYVPAQLKHFGFRDLILIDECHLLGPNEDTMYQYVIAELKKINPNLKVIGFTATPYRLKQGMITDEGLFTDIAYDMTGIEGFNRLIAEGFICPLIPKRTSVEIDVSNVGIMGGDFNNKQLSAAVDKDEITYAAVKEMIEQGHNRKAWLVFATSIENAEHIASMLQSFGIAAVATHSKLAPSENDSRIAAFKDGTIRALVNNNKLTTGFDFYAIDLIGMLRPTMSPGLWVQMLGRGTRPSPDTGKVNCLVLDFAGNTRRLGPINDPIKPRKPGKGQPGEAPVRICDACGVYNHASVRICVACGYEFPIETKIFATADASELLRIEAPIVEYFKVSKVLYNLHEKKDKEYKRLSPPSIKVSYFCGFQMFNEWVCLEHSGLAGKRARDWWRQRHATEPPLTTHEALQRVAELRVPSRIRVWTNKRYPEVLGHEF